MPSSTGSTEKLHDAIEGARRLIRTYPGAMPLGLDGALFNNDGFLWTVRTSDDGVVAVATIAGVPLLEQAERVFDWLKGQGIAVALLRLPPTVAPDSPA